MKNLLIATLLLGLLSGCAFLRSQVAVFHQLPKDFSGTTYVMIPFKEQEGSLEHKAYEEAVRQELNAKGFRETTLDQAQAAVFLSYAIDTGKEVVSSYPIIGQPESHRVRLMERFRVTAATAPILEPRRRRRPTGLLERG
jgi:hypothetical protein